MHPLAPFLAVPLLIGATITFSLAIYAWRRRDEPGVWAFLLTAIGLGAWSLFYALEIMSNEFETKLLWHKLIYTMLVFVPGPWALFLYQYETRIKRVSPWLLWALAVEPVAFIGLTWTNDRLHQLIWRDVRMDTGAPDLLFERGPFFWFHTGYSYLLILIATFFFVRMLWREPTLPQWQRWLLGLAAIFPLLVNLVHVVELNPFHPLDITPFALATTGAASAWYAFRFEIWDFLPAARNAIIESMSDGVIVLDVDYRIVDVNPAAAEMLGVSFSAVQGRPVTELLPTWEAPARLHQAVTTSELVLPGAEEERYIDLVFSPLYDRGERSTGALLTLRNVTRRRQAERALEHERTMLEQRVNEQTADLRKANMELARVAKMKDEFLANMSHELRTPLNTVLGLSEALQEQVYGPLAERQVRALRYIEESGRHLLALINDILDVSKIEAGKLVLELQPVHIDAVCQASVGLVRQMAHKKQIVVTYTPDPAVTIMQADERRLKQILVNLLGNAVKFTLEGGKIGLEVQGDTERETVCFTVWDTGIGIPDEDLRRLFQPFVQLDSRLARYHEGSGLGLALVYRMTKLHGGSVTATSEVGVGSRFCVCLPWREPNMSVFIHRMDDTETLTTMLRRVLLIDNSPASIDHIRRYLVELGIEVMISPPNADPIETARREAPDLIVLDAAFADELGRDLIGEFGQHAATAALPLLVLSASADLASPPSRHPQRVHYLLKSPSRSQLSQALLKLCQPPEPEEPLARHQVDADSHPVAVEAQPLILIVEDNETNIRTLTDYLAAKQYRLDTARSGSEAIQLVRSHRPDLILMDIQMPGMDGLEVIKFVRGDDALRAIPIIALTALAMPGDREKALAAGASDYLSKPVSLKRLVQTMEAHINHEPSGWHAQSEK
ncbi:MAG: response regulator [Caldilineaceae bacterium]|nr:response regulator [Caldilineaceae bacterium]